MNNIDSDNLAFIIFGLLLIASGIYMIAYW